MLVKKWFGSNFEQLHPLMQQLHLNGGALNGVIQIKYAQGLPGWIARRLAQKLNIPAAGEHELKVQIEHKDDGLHWNRCFNQQSWVRSVFTPVGTADKGYWIETTGPLTLRLTVDIADGGWYWRCLSIRAFGLPLPLWLFPQSKAYKRIENGGYRFFVGFRMPLVGELLSYSGLLKAE
ncbi:DUF4166 domain-containing protein [Pleionea sp. CnH1-48]|uniref:DUF4166 domain-containing protein n=1 Tax=Pleionea sp. CnH1-48 TaxID=2954494 RepID=UPI002097F9F3|nr:DUF4166 domain-containing protein [Pleionea sp. CnH1-48]MCO7223361.1 DUF4166 domain-containing protein [Pleionea sp. CnH1-48]